MLASCPSHGLPGNWSHHAPINGSLPLLSGSEDCCHVLLVIQWGATPGSFALDVWYPLSNKLLMILALSPDSSSLCRLGSYKACKSVECNPTAGISFFFCPDSESVSNTYFKQSTFPHCFKVPLSLYINFLDILHTNPWVFFKQKLI